MTIKTRWRDRLRRLKEKIMDTKAFESLHIAIGVARLREQSPDSQAVMYWSDFAWQALAAGHPSSAVLALRSLGDAIEGDRRMEENWARVLNLGAMLEDARDAFLRQIEQLQRSGREGLDSMGLTQSDDGNRLVLGEGLLRPLAGLKGTDLLEHAASEPMVVLAQRMAIANGTADATRAALEFYRSCLERRLADCLTREERFEVLLVATAGHHNQYAEALSFYEDGDTLTAQRLLAEMPPMNAPPDYLLKSLETSECELRGEKLEYVASGFYLPSGAEVVALCGHDDLGREGLFTGQLNLERQQFEGLFFHPGLKIEQMQSAQLHQAISFLRLDKSIFPGAGELQTLSRELLQERALSLSL